MILPRKLISFFNPIICLAAFLISVQISSANDTAAANIPESKIVELEADFPKNDKRTSSVRKRRACKTLVRDAEKLLESYADAPNQYLVLGIILKTQKLLLSLESSDRNREALFETCEKLLKAPNEYADLRLEADMMISERDLSAKNADVKVRTQALTELIARYRHTPGEMKSLMMASLIAPKLEAFDLEKQIFRTMNGRFAGNYDLIEWRRKNHGYAHEQVLFTGNFKTVNGGTLTFPIDGIGHTCLLVFWSKDTPQIALELAKVQELQSQYPGQIKVFSFNLDRLPDAGQKELRSMDLDWTALFLPEGKEGQVYRVVARKDPVVVRVNAHGHAFLPSPLIDELLKEVSMEQNFDDTRYLGQLQSLLIGEFLLPRDTPKLTAGSIPETVLSQIRNCFVDVPIRYRLTGAQALASYQKAERLCQEAIKNFPEEPCLWYVRNCRIIALLGIWKITFEPQYLADAVAESRAVLAKSIPKDVNLIPRFCLAIEALRQSKIAPYEILSELIASNASASGYAAATVLTMNVNAADLHAEYREKLLEMPHNNLGLEPVTTFLLDQNHRFRMFKYNYYMPASLARRIVRADLRSNAADLDGPIDKSGPIQAELMTISGKKLSLPQATDGKLTQLMFVELPEDDGEDFPVWINGSVSEDSRGRKVETLGVMQYAFQYAEEHVHKEIKVIAAILSDDLERIKVLMEKHAWPCEVAVVPGGIRNPLVRRLGILSADRVPNIVLLRPDGTIVWKLSGIVHPQLRAEGPETLHVISRALKTHIDRYEIERSILMLEEGNNGEAERLFSGPFKPPERPNPNGWTAPRFHGRALARIKLKRWDAALLDINAAIETHQWVHNRKDPCACHLVGELLSKKAMVLDKLGRTQEAQDVRKLAAAAKFNHATSRYGQLHDRIKAIK